MHAGASSCCNRDSAWRRPVKQSLCGNAGWPSAHSGPTNTTPTQTHSMLGQSGMNSAGMLSTSALGRPSPESAKTWPKPGSNLAIDGSWPNSVNGYRTGPKLAPLGWKPRPKLGRHRHKFGRRWTTWADIGCVVGAWETDACRVTLGPSSSFCCCYLCTWATPEQRPLTQTRPLIKGAVPTKTNHRCALDALARTTPGLSTKTRDRCAQDAPAQRPS